MASSSQHSHHLHQHQHQHQQHQLLLQHQHQQQQQQQHHTVQHHQQQRPSSKPQPHINPSPSPVMPFIAAAAAPSNPSSSSSSPAAQASEPHDIERPPKRQRTNASNLSLTPRLPPPPPVNVAPPQQQQQQQQMPQHHQRHHTQQKSEAQHPQPPMPPAAPAATSPVIATSYSSVPFLRVQEQGSSETFALPLAAVPNWDTLVSLLRDLFAKPPHSTPKLKTHRGDTIIKPLIKHFLKDGVHLSVAFEDHAPTHPQNVVTQAHTPAPTQMQSHHPSPVPPPLTITASNLGNNTSINNPNNGNVNGNNLISSPTFTSQPLPSSQNPPTPYSPPLHTTSSTPSTSSSSPLTTISASLSFPPPPPSTSQIPIYKMSRSLSTVAGLWQEWKTGLNSSPSVESLEARYGPKWRTSQAERKFYSRRKVIIEEITKRIAGGMDAWRAVEEVEEVRGGKSLDGLSKMIVERKKGAVGGGQGGRGRGRVGGVGQGQGVGEEDEDEEASW